MTDTLESLRNKIDGATELDSVVHTMKALAASSIVQYERAVHSQTAIPAKASSLAAQND